MLSLPPPASLIALQDPPSSSRLRSSPASTIFTSHRLRSLFPPRSRRRRLFVSSSVPEVPESEGPEALVQDLRVPDHWLLPSNARQESEWLRVALHEWLDAEYCPEDANIEISKVAAHSFYESLMRKQGDLGEILLKMASDLELLSFRESFHGPFSSANAAIHLITQRIDSMVNS